MNARIVLIAYVLSLAACARDTGRADRDTASARSTDTAAVTAVIRDASGRSLGTLTLAETAHGIALAGRLTGLPPGVHAIHIHSTGRCVLPFESAGGHWNPTNRQHGAENPQGHHLGDLPNVGVGSDSAVAVQVSTTGGALRGTNALLDTDGAAVIVHARPDDYSTDPAGNAGDRIACAVVTAT